MAIIRMPFGLKSAPITFQRLMNPSFASMIGENVYAYLDDFIIFSKYIDSHVTSFKSIMIKLREASLKAKLPKCDLSFLGRVVDADGIHTIEYKIKAIKKTLTPKTVDNAFLG